MWYSIITCNAVYKDVDVTSIGFIVISSTSGAVNTTEIPWCNWRYSYNNKVYILFICIHCVHDCTPVVSGVKPNLTIKNVPSIWPRIVSVNGCFCSEYLPLLFPSVSKSRLSLLIYGYKSQSIIEFRFDYAPIPIDNNILLLCTMHAALIEFQ